MAPLLSWVPSWARVRAWRQSGWTSWQRRSEVGAACCAVLYCAALPCVALPERAAAASGPDAQLCPLPPSVSSETLMLPLLRIPTCLPAVGGRKRAAPPASGQQEELPDAAMEVSQGWSRLRPASQRLPPRAAAPPALAPTLPPLYCCFPGAGGGGGGGQAAAAVRCVPRVRGAPWLLCAGADEEAGAAGSRQGQVSAVGRALWVSPQSFLPYGCNHLKHIWGASRGEPRRLRRCGAARHAAAVDGFLGAVPQGAGQAQRAWVGAPQPAEHLQCRARMGAAGPSLGLAAGRRCAAQHAAGGALGELKCNLGHRKRSALQHRIELHHGGTGTGSGCGMRRRRFLRGQPCPPAAACAPADDALSAPRCANCRLLHPCCWHAACCLLTPATLLHAVSFYAYKTKGQGAAGLGGSSASSSAPSTDPPTMPTCAVQGRAAWTCKLDSTSGPVSIPAERLHATQQPPEDAQQVGPGSAACQLHQPRHPCCLLAAHLQAAPAM